MSHVSDHAHALASFGTPVGAGGLFGGLRAFLQARRETLVERARIRRELGSYTDRQLGDLGISRLDIDAVAAGRYQR